MIIKHAAAQTAVIKNLKTGEVFCQLDPLKKQVYMRAYTDQVKEGLVEAVNMENGRVDWFSSGTLVIELEATLNLTPKAYK